MAKKFYGVYNRYGVFGNYQGHDEIFVFETKKDRDEWVKEEDYDGNNYVKTAVHRSRLSAHKMRSATALRKKTITCFDGVSKTIWAHI